MTTTTTRSLPRRIALAAALACACACLLLPAAAAAAEEKVAYIHESLKAYEAQLAAGQITAATFNKRVRSVHLTLSSGQHMLVKYGKGEEPKINAALKAKGVPVAVLTPSAALKEAKSKPVHHKLRYIAGGILIGVIVIVGAVLLIDRRRKRAAE